MLIHALSARVIDMMNACAETLMEKSISAARNISRPLKAAYTVR